MHDREPKGFVDDLLDAALKQYRSEEPRAGLEFRVLAGLRAQERAMRFNWTRAFAVAVAAAAVIAVWLAVPRHQHTPTPSAALSVAPKPAPAMVAARPISPPPHAPHRYRPERTAAHRPEQFPTPMPLTEQEKLLVLYVKQTPAYVLEAEARRPAEGLDIPQLRIAKLEIVPLPDSEVGQEKK
jgi:hypothetical protein